MDTIVVSRFEYKYLLRPAQVPEIRRFLLRYCTPDINAEGAEWYGIHSLYLDTGDYRFYRQSADKALERMKLRVRAYTTGNGPVKLEVKRRVNELVTKKSLLLPRDQWDKVGLDGLGTSSEFASLVERLRAAPKLLVDYERQAFHSGVDDYVRVTFDRRIRCQPMREWNVRGHAKAWRLVDEAASGGESESAYVLELKFKVLPPVWLHDMVTTFGLVRRGFSKYARGVRHTIADRETSWDLRAAMNGAYRAWRVA